MGREKQSKRAILASAAAGVLLISAIPAQGAPIYSLSTNVYASRMMTGSSTPVIITITNDSSALINLDYTGLYASGGGGSFTGSASSGGPIDVGDSSSNSFSFIAGSTGVQTISPTVGSVYKHLSGTTASSSGNAGDTVTVVANRVLSATSVNFGRVMINQAASGNSTLTTSGDNNHYTAIRVGSTTFNSASSTGTYTLNKTFGYSGAVSASSAVSVTAEGLAGESVQPLNISYSGTAVDNRVVTGSSVDFGDVLTGYNISGTSNLTTTGDSNHFTAITVDGQAFSSASSTGTHTVYASFGSSGSKSGTDTSAVVAGEGLAGEAPVAVNINYTANVFRPASLTAGGGGLPIQPDNFSAAANLTLTNDFAGIGGGPRAGVTVTSLTPSNPNFTAVLSNNPVVVDAISSSTSADIGTVRFADNRLNGVYAGSVSGTVRYTSSALNSQGSIANPTWGLQVTQTFDGAQSSGVADVKQAFVAAGDTYGSYPAVLSSYSLRSSVAGGFGSTAFMGDGTTTASHNTTLGASFYTPAEFAAAGKTDSPLRDSDIVHITGFNETGSTGFDGSTLSDMYLVQIKPGHTPGSCYLAWYDPTLNQWVNAIAGNSTLAGGMGTLTTVDSISIIKESYGNIHLGSYGVDPTTDTMWAVVDHTGDFAVIAVPEPTILGGILAVSSGLLIRKRQKKA